MCCSEKTEENIVDCLSYVGKVLVYPGVFQTIMGLSLIIMGFVWEITLLYILGFCMIGLTVILVSLFEWGWRVIKRREEREERERENKQDEEIQVETA